jgi:uncharacterized membrane protein YagU involved in acid resistance
MRHEVTRQQEDALVTANHFAYGAAAGSLYGCLFRRGSLPAAATGGAVYGVAVWAASYLGWLPTTGFYRSATEEPAGRNAVMLGAHLVWGASLGVATELLARACKPATNGSGNAQETVLARGQTSVLAES